jgi:hypothetical protein
MRLLSLGTLLVALVFAAGCGGGGGGGGGSSRASGEAAKSGTEVVQDAVQAADGASAVHISGEVDNGNQKIGVDLTLVRGKGATGTLTLGGSKVDLVAIGKTAYLRASPAFWKKYTQSSLAASLFAGKWIKFPADSAQFGSITSLTDDKQFFDQLTAAPGKTVNKGETTYNGESVVAVFDSKENGTLYVAASGTPYPVALVKTDPHSTGGKLSFDGWNQSVELTAPKGALDISKFGG